jgi:hypothetical protein
VLSFSEPWSIIEFTVLFIAAIIVALRDYGERLPDTIINNVSPFFRSKRWSAVPLLLIGVFMILVILQFLGFIPKDREQIAHTLSPALSAVAQSDEHNQTQIRALQSQLAAAQRQRDDAQQNLATVQAQLSAARRQAESAEQAAQRVPPRVGPIYTLNSFSAPEGLFQELLKTNTSVLVTSTPENEAAKFDLNNVLSVGASG